MSRNPNCSVFIGNLDERVTEKVLYEIAIQAGRIIDIHIPRDKETNKHKGYAFAEYESAEIAEYAIKLFNGLVKLYNRPVRFAASGQDKVSQNATTTLPIQNAYSSYSQEYGNGGYDSVLGDPRRQQSSYRPY